MPRISSVLVSDDNHLKNLHPLATSIVTLAFEAFPPSRTVPISNRHVFAAILPEIRRRADELDPTGSFGCGKWENTDVKWKEVESWLKEALLIARRRLLTRQEDYSLRSGPGWGAGPSAQNTPRPFSEATPLPPAVALPSPHHQLHPPASREVAPGASLPRNMRSDSTEERLLKRKHGSHQHSIDVPQPNPLSLLLGGPAALPHSGSPSLAGLEELSNVLPLPDVNPLSGQRSPIASRGFPPRSAPANVSGARFPHSPRYRSGSMGTPRNLVGLGHPGGASMHVRSPSRSSKMKPVDVAARLGSLRPLVHRDKRIRGFSLPAAFVQGSSTQSEAGTSGTRSPESRGRVPLRRRSRSLSPVRTTSRDGSLGEGPTVGLTMSAPAESGSFPRPESPSRADANRTEPVLNMSMASTRDNASTPVVAGNASPRRRKSQAFGKSPNSLKGTKRKRRLLKENDLYGHVRVMYNFMKTTLGGEPSGATSEQKEALAVFSPLFNTVDLADSFSDCDDDDPAPPSYDESTDDGESSALSYKSLSTDVHHDVPPESNLLAQQNASVNPVVQLPAQALVSGNGPLSNDTSLTGLAQADSNPPTIPSGHISLPTSPHNQGADVFDIHGPAATFATGTGPDSPERLGDSLLQDGLSDLGPEQASFPLNTFWPGSYRLSESAPGHYSFQQPQNMDADGTPHMYNAYLNAIGGDLVADAMMRQLEVEDGAPESSEAASQLQDNSQTLETAQIDQPPLTPLPWQLDWSPSMSLAYPPDENPTPANDTMHDD